ncbi:methyl-accepting chemotaxis protein [Marinimicrobium sp. ABcell2]|uniref:methyl-accepting chemotaxis protein n=1 Tax=Marinimicrobium sp. ABcell2 TaxID=3069751 RepID=UPI0027B7481A|nr:methyl-accepting chemotaxis protein [Marinimicrobium sp. ABcell2]MDQ2077914.1 methyl-accepting chemotaxis protein [Marinimicrobium sp. ABcell2]
MKLNLTLVQQVIAGFTIVLGLQLLVASLSLSGQQRLANRVEMASQTITPLMQETAALTREAQQAAQLATQHAAETELRRLAPMQGAFLSATQAYNESMKRTQRLLDRLGDGQGAIQRVDTSIKGAFTLAEQHLEIHEQQLRATEAEYRALHDFEDTWQYFSPEMNDARFGMTEEELPARWLLASLEQDANHAAALLSRVPSMRSEESLAEVADQLTYFLGNIEAKNAIMLERFPMLADRLSMYVNLLVRHIRMDNGVLELQRRRLALGEQSRVMLQDLVLSLQTGLTDLASFNEQLKDQLDRTTLETRQSLNNSRSTIVIAFIVALIVGVAIAYRVVRGVRVPLRQLVKRLERLAKQDLRDNEAHCTEGEFGTISRSLDTLVGSLRHVIGQLKKQSDDLSELSTETSRISTDSRRDIDNQKAQTETVASAATEMEYTAKDVANNARETNQVVAQIDSSAQEGRKTVLLNRELVESLDSELTLGVDVMTELREQSQRIGSIVSVIQDIAEQTNLLALNAAIEAARAGDQGRGFAVVADEVRALASKTRASTSEINNMVESLQDCALKAADIMFRNKEKAIQCVEQSDLTRDSFQGILSELQRIKKMTIGIATVAEEQSRVTSEVAKSVVIISSVSDGVQRHAVDLEESSQRLTTMATTQQKLTAKFSM